MSDTDTSNELTAEEKLLLRKHLDFYQSLARGERTPQTEAQKHFVRVFCGQATPQTVHEKAYLKYRRIREAQHETESRESNHDPADGPTEEWFSREDWYKLRCRQRGDMRGTWD